MRVTKYDTRLDADKLPMLVKESAFNYNGKLNMTTPNEIYWFLNDHEDLEGLDKECLWLLCFNTKQKLIGYFLVSTGSINVSFVPIREVFIKALAVGEEFCKAKEVDIVEVTNKIAETVRQVNDECGRY